MSGTTNAPALLDAGEVARRLRCSRPYVYKLQRLGLISSVSWTVPGASKDRQVVRFLDSDVHSFIERHRRRISS